VARDFGARTYSWEGFLPYASANGTTECLTATDGPYSFPTGVALPTDRVGELDTGDPRGLGYCYESDHYMPITDDLFWSPFQGTLIDALHNESNCKQETRAWAPAVVATQATFLLQTTTDFIDGPETKSPTPSAPIKESLTPTDVRVDPFQTESQSKDEQEPIPTRPAPDRTTPVTKQSLKASGATADQINPPSKDDDKPKPSESHNARPTAPADEVSKSQAVESPAPTDEITDPGDNPAPAPKTGQLEILNSLIQDVGQDQSSIKSTASAGKDAPTITFNGFTATPDSSSEYVLDEQTLKPGGPAITISGTKVSLAPGASPIVVGSSTSVLVASGSLGDKAQDDSPAPVLTLTANSNSASEYVIEDQTIKPGGPAITISGTPISLDTQATALVVGSSTMPVAVVPYGGDQAQQESAQLAAKPPARLTLAGTAATLNSASEYVIADQTLKPGGPAITVSGTPISLAPQATAVVVGSSTSILVTALHAGDQAQQTGELPSMLTLAGVTATLNSASEYVIAGQTLIAGGTPITVSSTPISLVSQATAVVIGTSTSILVPDPRSGDQAQQGGKLAPTLTLAGATATLNSASEYVIDGQTLTPGGNAITLSGARISLAPGATAVVIGSSTSALPAASTNIGDYVWAGIAGVLASAEASSTASAEASETKSGSEIVVTSTASDGEVVVETIFTAGSTSSSPIDFSSSTAGASSFASGETSSTSSSSSPSGTSDAASTASFTKSVADLTALVFWVGVVTMFGM
jgi:uncharacterized protein YodC (DUF2158 family)